MLSRNSTSSAAPLNGAARIPPTPAAQSEAASTQVFASAPADLTPLKAPAPSTYIDHESQGGGDPTPEKLQGALVVTSSSAQETKPSATCGPALFLQRLKEGTLLINESAMTFLKKENISTSFKVFVVAGTVAGIIAATYHSISSGLGAAGFVLCNLGTTLEKNTHLRAQFVIHGLVLGGHFWMAGNETLAAVNAIFAGRMLTHSMLPQSNTTLNGAVAVMGVVISSAMFCCADTFSPGITIENAPLIGICAGGIASTLKNRFSWISRSVSVGIFSLMVPYHCMVSGSLFFAALSATLGYGTLKTIQEKDIPKVRGKKLSVLGFFKELSAPDATPEKKEDE